MPSLVLLFLGIPILIIILTALFCINVSYVTAPDRTRPYSNQFNSI